jgi:hypothetical protein
MIDDGTSCERVHDGNGLHDPVQHQRSAALTNRFIDGSLEYLQNASNPNTGAAPEGCCIARKMMEDRYAKGDFQSQAFRSQDFQSHRRR